MGVGVIQMIKLIAMALALVMGIFVFGPASSAYASVAPTPMSAQAEAAKSEVTNVYYYRRYRTYRTYYRRKSCTRWYRTGYGRVKRWCRYS